MQRAILLSLVLLATPVALSAPASAAHQETVENLECSKSQPWCEPLMRLLKQDDPDVKETPSASTSGHFFCEEHTFEECMEEILCPHPEHECEF